MSKKNKKNNLKNMQYINRCMLSQEQMIEIQEEAYYRALKRIEQEHILNKELKGKMKKKKFKRSERVLLVLNALFFPWKINKNFFIDNQIYDCVLVMSTFMIMTVVGSLMWALGIGWLIDILIVRRIDSMIEDISKCLVLLFLGSAFILSGKAFEKETDSTKIYAYSASIYALISCIAAIITIAVK